MPTMTLNEMTKKILSSLESMEISSISDTTESMQVVDIIETCYYDLIATIDLPSRKRVFELLPSLDPLKPVIMYKPENCAAIEWVKYDNKANDLDPYQWEDVQYLDPKCFLDRQYRIPVTDPNRVQFVHTISGGVRQEFVYLNNKKPEYYTSLDDSTILFDSFNAAYDTTLQNQKSMIYGIEEPIFVKEDSFVPPLGTLQFQLLFNEAKSLAFAEIKQTTHAKAEQTARRLRIRLQRNKTNVNAYLDDTVKGNAYPKTVSRGWIRRDLKQGS